MSLWALIAWMSEDELKHLTKRDYIILTFGTICAGLATLSLLAILIPYDPEPEAPNENVDGRPEVDVR